MRVFKVREMAAVVQHHEAVLVRGYDTFRFLRYPTAVRTVCSMQKHKRISIIRTSQSGKLRDAPIEGV